MTIREKKELALGLDTTLQKLQEEAKNYRYKWIILELHIYLEFIPGFIAAVPLLLLTD